MKDPTAQREHRPQRDQNSRYAATLTSSPHTPVHRYRHPSLLTYTHTPHTILYVIYFHASSRSSWRTDSRAGRVRVPGFFVFPEVELPPPVFLLHTHVQRGATGLDYRSTLQRGLVRSYHVVISRMPKGYMFVLCRERGRAVESRLRP